MSSTFANLNYHVVFSTKDREPTIESDWRPRMHDFLGGCVRTAGGVCLEIGGVADHVHLLLGLKPTHCVANLMRDVKHASSAWARDTFNARFTWQEGYGAFTVSRSVCRRVVDYIRHQEEHHRGRSFEQEYRELLERAGIAFDDRYLFR